MQSSRPSSGILRTAAFAVAMAWTLLAGAQPLAHATAHDQHRPAHDPETSGGSLYLTPSGDHHPSLHESCPFLKRGHTELALLGTPQPFHVLLPPSDAARQAAPVRGWTPRAPPSNDLSRAPPRI